MSEEAALLERYRRAGLRIVTAESCTGGLVAARLTDIAGASDVVERGFVTYSNEAKTEMLGVPVALLAQYGAVSVQVARAMAEGALGHARADVAIAVTGIAGPGGATPGKSIGLVYLAVARRGRDTQVERQHFSGDRAAVRNAAADRAVELLHAAAE
jgi:nicotinamide-nucleotide amidase